ncbi:MAG: hypothetical protein K2P17_01280 [Helicobacteraceae bacterium]|nr:hypothetical protein [Helicobacteraceae bacterium]
MESKKITKLESSKFIVAFALLDFALSNNVPNPLDKRFLGFAGVMVEVKLKDYGLLKMARRSKKRKLV